MPKYNVENLKNIHRYHNELQQQIDDADWMGEYDDDGHVVIISRNKKIVIKYMHKETQQ